MSILIRNIIQFLVYIKFLKILINIIHWWRRHLSLSHSLQLHVKQFVKMVVELVFTLLIWKSPSKFLDLLYLNLYWDFILIKSGLRILNFTKENLLNGNKMLLNLRIYLYLLYILMSFVQCSFKIDSLIKVPGTFLPLIY